MIILFEGPQGSGKGTYSQMLAEKLGALSFESGRELRRISRQETALGREIREVLDGGGLVSDREIYFLTKDWLSDIPAEKILIFDGCPRRLSQAEQIEDLLAAKGEKFDLVIVLRISDEVAIERLLERLVCIGPAEHIFNRKTRPPKKEGICDYDGMPLVKREDETPETIKARLATYHRETQGVIEYFRAKGTVEEIDAERPIEVVFGEMVARIRERLGVEVK